MLVYLKDLLKLENNKTNHPNKNFQT